MEIIIPFALIKLQSRIQTKKNYSPPDLGAV